MTGRSRYAPAGIGFSTPVRPPSHPSLTESERLLVINLARLQPTTFKELGAACGWTSAQTTVAVVDRLRSRGLICHQRVVPGTMRLAHDARSLRLVPGIVITERGQVGRFIEVA